MQHRKMKRSSGHGVGVNPQEATIPEEGEEEFNGEESPHQKPENSNVENDDDVKKVSSSSRHFGLYKKKEKKPKRHQQQSLPHGGGDHLMDHELQKMKKRKKRNRIAYMANIESTATCSSGAADDDNEASLMVGRQQGILLPLHHYTATLTRRAIRKREEGRSPPSPPRNPKTQLKNKKLEERETDDSSGLQEEYGDISLGMKLSVVGGKVIVQKLNSLSDGRASPAQVVGAIERGDVLLSINNKSLVNLPINLMMERLQPLSAPDASGAYQRILYLRLAAGEGLELLRKHEADEARKANVVMGSGEAASEVFSLFPMVDNLSGIPLFESHPALAAAQRPRQHQEEKKQLDDGTSNGASPAQETEKDLSQLTGQQKQQQSVGTPQRDEKTSDEIISEEIARWRSMERKNFTSEFYSWNDNYSELLRPSEGSVTASVVEANDKPLTRSEKLALGRRALLGAENFVRAVEQLDRGKDVRSFRSWNSSISLRSRASTRRRYVMDAVSLPVRLDTKTVSHKGGTVGASLASGSVGSDMENVDGDALLLRLAAHDEIWRRQVIEALEEAREKVANDAETEASEDESQGPLHDDGDDPITNELGAFLFGETMAKIVTKKKKSKALPPVEITAVLFDLSTTLASSMPEEVEVGDGVGRVAIKSSLVPFVGKRHPGVGSSVILATEFLLDEALVVWLQTFRPLPWESRRVLWPLVKHSPTNAAAHSSRMLLDNDSLTLDSGMSPTSAYTSGTNGNRRPSKDLRQQVEDQELDVETRAETCFLVTYFFTRRLLPKLAPSRTENDAAASMKLVEFVKKYGAYMKLQSCMAYAAALKSRHVVNELVLLAEHDLRHREVIRLFSKRNALILYEPTMLSAVVKCLPLVRDESNADRRQGLVDICVSAYPDLCPWQVKEVLLGTPGQGRGVKNLTGLYYYYLSSLLHPQDGHDSARHDADLVKEWCILSSDESNSTNKSEIQSRKRNFLSVASRSSSDHLSYHRDLAMLIKHSMASREYNLALDLANEIVGKPTRAQNETILEGVLDYLKEIARDALDKGANREIFRTMKRVVRLFEQMSIVATLTFSFAEELHELLKYKEKHKGHNKWNMSSEIVDLVHFFAQEAAPTAFLRAFNSWTEGLEWPFDAITVVETVLKRGTKVALNNELSGSLLRLRRARQRMKTSVSSASPTTALAMHESDKLMTDPTVWSLMSRGFVALDK